jgi:hypothetical protein
MRTSSSYFKMVAFMIHLDFTLTLKSSMKREVVMMRMDTTYLPLMLNLTMKMFMMMKMTKMSLKKIRMMLLNDKQSLRSMSFQHKCTPKRSYLKTLSIPFY